jgi:hypothetical protein
MIFFGLMLHSTLNRQGREGRQGNQFKSELPCNAGIASFSLVTFVLKLRVLFPFASLASLAVKLFSGVSA